LLAVLTLATASPAFAALTVTNTSSYAGGGRWAWSVFVDADAETLRQIECVEYTLHPTFPNPVRRVCNQSKTGFALSTNGWGTFRLAVSSIVTGAASFASTSWFSPRPARRH
jgi:transcription initiation factor IIF auxiliary subunit